MLGSCNDVAERLYLQKDASGEISVPCSKLAQHQIDGLRFLFSQYKKEKVGVILNYPPGCGSCVQVVIFISAIYEKLKRPVLILYNSDQEKEAWLARFAKWTSISEDSIEVDTSNPYVRKQIFIKNVADVSKFYRRSWGIVVVKSDSFLNVFRKCQLEVDFKIWITSQDLKLNRELLHLVYTWLNPSDKLLQAYLSRETPSVLEEDTTNEILLDLLLEDFLITRTGLRPFGAQKRRQSSEVSVQKVSKKNKDATGKKIKRSKKNQETPATSTICIENVTSLRDNNDSFGLSSVFSKTSSIDKVATSNVSTNIGRTDNDDEESKMDVESFIRNNDPLKSDINLSFAINNLDSTSPPSTSNSPKVEEVCTEGSLNFASAIADIIRIENNEPTEISDDSVTFKPEDSKNVCDLTESAIADIVRIENNEPTEISNDSVTFKSEDSKNVCDLTQSAIADIVRIENNEPTEISNDSVTFKTEDSKNVCDLTQSAIADIVRIENNELTEISNDSVTFKTEDSKNDCNLTQEVAEILEVEDSTGLNKIDLSKPVIQKVFFISSQDNAFDPTTDDQVTVEDKTDKKSSGEGNRIDVVDQTSKLEVSTSVMKETDSSFDSKMKKFEERALRKFKGSVLDNIF